MQINEVNAMSPESEQRLLEAYRAIFDAVREPGTDRIMQAAYRIFGCPVLYTDEYFHVVSMVPSTPIGDEAWDYMVEKKDMRHERIWAIMDEFLSGKKEFYSIFYADTGSCAACPRIFGEVVLDERVQGHVMVFLGDIPLREEDFKIVELIIDALCIKIQSRTKGMSRWNLSLTTKLQDLIDPVSPPHLMRLACDAVGAAIEPEYTVIATPVGQKASQRAFAEYAVSQLHQMYRHIIAVIYDNCIVTLVGGVRRRSRNGNLTPAAEGSIRKILDYFTEHDMVSGVSNCFNDLTQTRPHYRQALLTAQMALRLELGTQQFFMDLMPLPIFLSVLEHEQPETFVHPAVTAMREYDASHGTEYYATMRAFSMTMHNKDQTAALLNIHRNTLLYRLGRIAELFELPYEEERAALNILCSYLILELREHATPEQVTALLESDREKSEK